MYSRQDEEFFHRLISGMDQNQQLELNLMYTHNRMRYNLYHKKEMEQLKKEIVEEVLARISVKVDTGEAIQEVKGLNKELEKFEKLAGGGH